MEYAHGILTSCSFTDLPDLMVPSPQKNNWRNPTHRSRNMQGPFVKLWPIVIWSSWTAVAPRYFEHRRGWSWRTYWWLCQELEFKEHIDDVSILQTKKEMTPFRNFRFRFPSITWWRRCFFFNRANYYMQQGTNMGDVLRSSIVTVAPVAHQHSQILQDLEPCLQHRPSFMTWRVTVIGFS